MTKKNIKLIAICIFSIILFCGLFNLSLHAKQYTNEVVKIKKEIRNINKEIKAKEKENNSVEVKKLQKENQDIQDEIDKLINQNENLQVSLDNINKKAVDVKGSKWIGTYEFEQIKGHWGYNENLEIGKVSIDFNEHDTSLKFEGIDSTLLHIIGPTAKVDGEFGYIKIEDSKSTNPLFGEEYENREYEVHITINNDKLTGIIVDEAIHSSGYYVVGSFEATKVK